MFDNPHLLSYLLYVQDPTYQPKPPELLAVMTEDDEIEAIEIDRLWTGVRYLLGTFPTVEGLIPSVAVLGLKEIRPEEFEEDRKRYLTPKEVKILAQALNNISENEFISRYDPKALNKLEIYPEWDENAGGYEKYYLKKHFSDLQNYYRDAALRGNAMIIFKT